LFRKWLEDGSLVRCEGHFSMYAFSFRGRIVAADDQEVRLMSSDTQSQVVMRIPGATEFAYVDTRDVEGLQARDKEHECCLVAFFGPLGEIGDPPTDSIAFAPLKTD
jgi:hypothetical protein